jgi:polyphosphate kinase
MKAANDPGRLFINRELSWLEFNERVLREGRSVDVPLLERLKLLAIVGSNLDEFLMIRVAGLRQQVEAGVTKPDVAGMSPRKQLDAIHKRVKRMVADRTRAIRDVLAALREQGFCVRDISEVRGDQRRFLNDRFRDEVLPVLTPLAVARLNPFPHLPGSSLNVAAVLEAPDAGGEAAGEGGSADPPEPRLGVVPIPDCLPRFVRIPGDLPLEVVPLEDLVRENLGQIFPGHRIAASAIFRITRDADVVIDDDDVSDLLETVESAVRERRRRAVVRLELTAGPDPRLKKWLLEWCDVSDQLVLEIDGILGTSALMELAARPGFDSLKYEEWPPREPADLIGADDIWEALRDRDVMISLPYESFDPVVRLVDAAADDPNVLAIKQTLYRTENGSAIVAALARAAEAGKQVTVLVELKARFDEAKNVVWARRLEDAGCHVIYGIAGYKTHGKALLIVRREGSRFRRYLHLSTGNYNAKTAKLYADIGYMTSDPEMASDAAAFFNLLTGYSQPVEWKRFAISPKGIRRRFEELIQREVDASTPDQPGLIMAKMNSLHDEQMCLALYCASQAGVRVLLNVRGICCLRPGIKGISENIEVVSIVDRFLEHARVFYFSNGGHEEVYLSSADWMTRNLDKRLELLFPVSDPALRRRAVDYLQACFADNVKASRLAADGTWRRRGGRGKKVRAQELLYTRAVEAEKAAGQGGMQFKPLKGPE